MAEPKKTERNFAFSSLQSEIDRLVENSQQPGKSTARGLLKSWESVAQETVLAHTDNVVYSTRSEQTEILVFVDDATWAAELTMNKEIYRLLMEKQLNKPVADIKFLVSRKTAFRKKDKNLSLRPPSRNP